MKKIIACILTLCMAVSIAAVGWSGGGGAAAEATDETSGAVVIESTQPEPTPDTVTAAPESAATETPTTDETVTETPSAEATVTPDATDAAGTTETPAATAEATIVPDAAGTTPAVEADVGTGPAWVVESAHRHYGELDELLPIAIVNNLTIYLCTTGAIELTGYTVDELRTVAFGLDEDTLGTEYCDGRTVIVSTISSSGATSEGIVYIWVGRASEVPTPEQVLGDEVSITTDESALLETEIMVQATGYTADAACTPSFTLVAYPDLTEGMTFAVSTDGADPQAIEGNSFTPLVSGVYRFAVLDATGALAARSIEYTVIYGMPETTPDPAVTETEQPEPTVEAPELLTQADILESVPLTETEPDATQQPPELTVRTYDYVENALSSQTPSFELSGAPETGGYYYGISINGSAIYTMRDNLYAVTKSGDFTLTFYLLDADGNPMDASGEYHVIVDYAEAEQNNEAWMAVDGVKLYGTLASLLREAGSSNTIYLLTSGVVALTDSTKLTSVNLAADPDTFGEGSGVVVSDNNPDGESAEGTTYIWVGVDVSPMALAMFSAFSAPTFTIDSVSIGSHALSDGLWVNGTDAVTFAITDADPANTYGYEISTDGGVTFAPFGDGGALGGLSMASGNTYAVVFRVTDADDPANVVTAAYSLQYDDEAPVLICKAGVDNTLSFYAGDSVSGFANDTSVNNVTFNATASPISWVAHLTYQGQNVYTYSVQYKGAGTIAAGTLGVMDQAGNVAVWGKDITISAGSGEGGGGMSGGMSGSMSGSMGGTGSGVATRTVYHSASTYTTVTAYNGVELVVETGTMNTLTIGDQLLDLSLKLDGATQQPEGYEPSFMADFVDWKGGNGTETTDAESDNAAVDTLVLSADEAAQVDGEYCWTFDGSVYKKLAASGIDYLVLSVGDNVTALSTAGFAAGIRYNMYRAAGLSSKEFVYTVRMSAAGTVQIEVTVGSETYTLTSDQTNEFYYYDVYCGTMDMLNKPFGQEGVQGTAAEGRQG